MPSLIFCISQGKAATYIRCGGKYDNSFTAHLLLSLAVNSKRSLKSFKICQSYQQIPNGTFFDSQCINRLQASLITITELNHLVGPKNSQHCRLLISFQLKLATMNSNKHPRISPATTFHHFITGITSCISAH